LKRTNRIDLTSFKESVNRYAIPASVAENNQAAMTVLYLAVYSEITTLGPIDFESFQLKDGEKAYEELLYSYILDDIHDSLEDKEVNKRIYIK